MSKNIFVLIFQSCTVKYRYLSLSLGKFPLMMNSNYISHLYKLGLYSLFHLHSWACITLWLQQYGCSICCVLQVTKTSYHWSITFKNYPQLMFIIVQSLRWSNRCPDNSSSSSDFTNSLSTKPLLKNVYAFRSLYWPIYSVS